MAQNVMVIIEHHRKSKDLIVYTLSRTREILSLQKRDNVDAICGIFGMWRTIIPQALESYDEYASIQSDVLEIYDLCLHHVTSCPKHTIINASLEVLHVLTLNSSKSWELKLKSVGMENMGSKSTIKLQFVNKAVPEPEEVLTEAVKIIESEQAALIEQKKFEPFDLEGIEMTQSSASRMNQSHTISSEMLASSIEIESGLESALESLSIKSFDTDVVTSPLKHANELGIITENPNLDAKYQEIKSDFTDLHAKFDFEPFLKATNSSNSVLLYTLRTLCSKFLLSAEKDSLISDSEVRVSIKHLSLSVMGNILQIIPESIGKSMTPTFESKEVHNYPEIDVIIPENRTDDLLEIKDDHFGPSSTTNIIDFLSPLSKSADETMLKEAVIELPSRMVHSEIVVRENRSDSFDQGNQDTRFIYEVLRFTNHSDPILRADVISVIENLLKAVSKKFVHYQSFLQSICDKNPSKKMGLELKMFLDIVRKVRVFSFLIV